VPLRSEAAMSNFEGTILPGRCNSLLVEKSGPQALPARVSG
jgi:hypothetical protein